jgi:hypothetical protein
VSDYTDGCGKFSAAWQFYRFEEPADVREAIRDAVTPLTAMLFDAIAPSESLRPEPG